MPSLIRPNRLVIDDRFPVCGFTVRTDGSPKWIEVALAADDPTLFRADRKTLRTRANFSSSSGVGPLQVEHGEAVYLVPPEVLSRFVGRQKLYYALATFSDPGRSKIEIATMPSTDSPWIDIKSFTGRTLRRLRGVPLRGGLTGSGNGYSIEGADTLEWAGDTIRPGAEPIDNPPAASTTPAAPGVQPTAVTPSAPPSASQSVTSMGLDYDDGFDPSLWSRPQEAVEDLMQGDDRGIEGPVPDASPSAEPQAFSRPLSTLEYPQANRFVPAATTNYRASSAPRTINRVVIHITDGGANINGPISWFQNSTAGVSAHYIVGQDGEIVQMVGHNDVAWHARRANADSIGIEHVANTHGLVPTPAEYCSSAALVRWLCDFYAIPIDRTHILGHSEADPRTTHTGCPNAVWDWDYFMGMVTSATCYPPPSSLALSTLTTAVPFSSDLPLDPGNGGMSIGSDALDVGDIIVSTTSEFISGAIRQATGAPVSHTMLYTGDGDQVVEAIGEGVVFRPLADALASATVAVAFRHPDLTAEQRLRMRDFVGSHIDKPYNRWGIFNQAKFIINGAVCNLLSGEVYERCRGFYGRVYLGTDSDETFFCSELILAAYEAAGVPLTNTPPNWGTPGALADLRLTGKLSYVGHLKAPPLPSSQGFRAVNIGGYGNGQGYSSRSQADAPSREAHARAGAIMPSTRPMQVAEIASEIAGAIMTRILDNQGDISWELDQLQGLKHPDNNLTNVGTATYATTTITVPGPRASTVLGLDKIYADFELTFQHNGHSLGNIQITTLRANDAAGAGLAVKANIMDEANSYARPPNADRFAAIKVRFHYRFTSPVYGDLIAITDLVLYGDGTYDQRFRWTQR